MCKPENQTAAKTNAAQGTKAGDAVVDIKTGKEVKPTNFTSHLVKAPEKKTAVVPGAAPIEGNQTGFKGGGRRSLLSSFASLVSAKAQFGNDNQTLG